MQMGGLRVNGRVLRAARMVMVTALVTMLVGIGSGANADPLDALDPYLDEPLVPAHNAGGGSTMGSMSYVPAMPRAGAACKSALAVGIDWSSEAFVFNTVVSGFAGNVSITGTGTSDCESYTTGSGSLSLEVKGTNDVTGSRLDCWDDYVPPPGTTATATNLTGTYTRVLSHMTVVLFGNCVVNGFGVSYVMFAAQVEVVPIPPEGTQTSVATAQTGGAFVVLPV